MQYLLTQEEYDALRVKRGVDTEVVEAARKALSQDLFNILRDTQSPWEGLCSPRIDTIREALHKFDAALEQPSKPKQI